MTDEFAQTRGGDDLFDDEIVPVAAEEQVQPESEPRPQPEPQEEPVAAEKPEIEAPPARTDTPRSRGGERGRGRGRSRGRGGRGGQHPGQRRQEGGPKSKPVENTPEQDAKSVVEPAGEQSTEGTESTKDDDAASETKQPVASNGADAQRVPAVRGDRSGTGGLKKPKLTEEELSQRIAAAKVNAAKKAAAHARAEADHASFLEREKVAEVKRRQERQERRVMDNERERNRQRKLGALAGREWDSVKREEDYNPRGGGSRFRRGMHGGVSGHTRRDFDDNQPGDESSGSHPSSSNYRGRGRGGRGGRGRGNSRNPRDPSTLDTGSNGLADSKYAPAPVLDNEANFPSLPASEKKEEKAEAPAPPAVEADKLTSLSPITGGGSWAEQVESQ